jgi:hypothetical protein
MHLPNEEQSFPACLRRLTWGDHGEQRSDENYTSRCLQEGRCNKGAN